MATLVSDPIRYIADQWEDHCGYSSAVLSGIVPDSRHLDNGGYHCSVEDLRKYGNSRDYSNTRPDDKDQNVRYGAAVDVSMSPADMKKCHDRVRRVWADKTDPRRRFLNAINAWDGSGDAVRLDFVTGAAGYASPDHKWHNHGEVRRRYLIDMTAAKAIVSALKGESKQQYLSNISPTNPPTVEAFDVLDSDPKKPIYKDGPSERQAVADLHYAAFRGNPGSSVEQQSLARIEALLTALSGRDFTNEPEIIAGVLGGLNPEAIAAAIPPTMAKQVANELARRLVAE
ncbi:hypothetical protein AB0J14_04770 [Micromonospora arborensis]|uniref:hypothetical protein n=1 Tax=Micromonospora arborensis TaxID=2116518 RepID=UPI0033DC0BC2